MKLRIVFEYVSAVSRMLRKRSIAVVLLVMVPLLLHHKEGCSAVMEEKSSFGLSSAMSIRLDFQSLATQHAFT